MSKAPPAVTPRGGPPRWPEYLKPLMSTGEWVEFGPFNPSYARSLKWRFDNGITPLPDGTNINDWEMVVRYLNPRGRQTTARAAHKSVLWVRWAGRRRRTTRKGS